jgi:hypothetical protein
MLFHLHTTCLCMIFVNSWHWSISCSLNQSADWVIEVAVKWHTFLITVFVLICSFKNIRFLYYCYIHCDVKVEFCILLQFEAFVIWCFFHIAYYFIDGCDAVVFEYIHYTVHVNKHKSNVGQGNVGENRIIWICRHRQKTIEILPLGVWDFSILTCYRCQILLFLNI